LPPPCFEQGGGIFAPGKPLHACSWIEQQEPQPKSIVLPGPACYQRRSVTLSLNLNGKFSKSVISSGGSLPLAGMGWLPGLLRCDRLQGVISVRPPAPY
jgi:hypothetical protein